MHFNAMSCPERQIEQLATTHDNLKGDTLAGRDDVRS